MKAKLSLDLSRHRLRFEEFDRAIFCGGAVFPWRREYIVLSARSGCGTLSVPGGSYFREYGFGGREMRYLDRDLEYKFDEPGACVELIRVLQTEPLRLDCVEYVSVEEGDEPTFRPLEEDWTFSGLGDGVCLESYHGDCERVLAPAFVGGRPVSRLCLDCASLGEGCRELIISEGIAEVSLDLSAARGLKRLEFPSSARFISPPRGIEGTRWYKSRSAAVYLGGCYCGTPGGGLGGDGQLSIREGTLAVACGADFHCSWRSIVMPESLRVIGDLAFADAARLEELRLPSAVERIGNFAFQHCPRLDRVYLPDSVRESTAPFMLCDRLREVSMAADCPLKTRFSSRTRLVLRETKKGR